MITPQDLDNWFTYHKPTEHQIPCFTKLRDAARAFCEVVIATTPPSADQTAAIRKVREAVATANAAIACNEVHVELEKVANMITAKCFFRGQFIHKHEESEQSLLAVGSVNKTFQGFYEMSAKIIDSRAVRPELIQHAMGVAAMIKSGAFGVPL